MPDDTNRRVAEACGFRCRVEKYKLGTFLQTEVNGQWCVFVPHDAADHAVLAAEKFGLFDLEKHDCEIYRWCGNWGVFYANGEEISRGTFCETICQAILKLAADKAAT